MADEPANAQQAAAAVTVPTTQPPSVGLTTNLPDASSHSVLKRRLSAAFEAPVLTGAAALADERKRATEGEDAQRQRPQPPQPAQTSEAPQTTPNPAVSSLNALRNGMATLNPVSRPAEAPAAAMSTPTPRPQLPSITHTATTAEPMSLDQPQTTSPTSISSAEALGSKAARALDTRADGPGKPPSEAGSAQEERQRPVAMTYPGPQQQLGTSNGPSRQMSLPTPGSASKSPNKKHKCPHCSTEFTRHHNLKSHLLTHSQEKPYACSTCHARFRRLHDLKRHNKLHTGERPHTCDRCGRKFARGDALARHNKGPGGCAGRRASMDEDYIEGESGYDDGMEGVVYDDGQGPGEEQAEFDRRKSDSGQHHRAPTLQSQAEVASSPFRQHSSTYPGSAAVAAQSRNQFAQPLPSPSHLAASGGGGASSYSSQLNAGPGVFAQGGMTESPKPLSPGQTDTRRLSAANEGSYSRGRSPSHVQYPPASQYSRGPGRGTPPIALPPPGIQHGHSTQLPPIKAATGQYAPTGAPGSASNAGSSVSSAQQSSGSSMREITSLMGSHAPAGIPAEASLYEHVKYLERQVAQLKEDGAVSERHYETKIARIMDENRELRSQLNSLRQGRV